MTAEQIRKMVKRGYEDKLNALTDDNYKLHKENEELRKANEALRKRVETLELKESQRDRRADALMAMVDSLEQKGGC